MIGYRRKLIAWVCMLASLAAADRLFAQGRSYQPSHAKFSPYLQLFRTDPGQILPSYQAYVVPRIEARRFKRQQETHVRQLDRGLREVRELEVAPTGVAGQFRNSGQFFRTSPAYYQTHRRRR